MSSNHEDLLRRATEALRAGKKQEAYSYLEEILEEDDENIKAWLLFYRATDDVNEKRIALTTVLQLDPTNVKAKEALNKLEGKRGKGGEEEIAPGISRRQIIMLVGGTIAAIVVIALLLIVVNSSRDAERRQLEAQQTAFVLEPTLTADAGTAIAIAATETQFAIATPTPTATNTRLGPPTLPPTFTPTATNTPLTTATPLPAPVGLTGVIIGWGGRDLSNDDMLPVVSIPLNGGGQFTEVSAGERGRYVAATNMNNIVFSRFSVNSFDWALALLDVTQGGFGILGAQWQDRTTHKISNTTHPQYSVDGSRLVFSGIDLSSIVSNVYIYDTTAPVGTDPIIKVSNDGQTYTYPAISPDGRLIVAVRSEGPEEAPTSQDLVYLNVETLAVAPLTTDGTGNLETSPRWSPDGQIIAYASAPQSDPNNHDIFIRTADGSGGALNITNHPGDDVFPVFSSDSRYMAFSSNRQGPYNLYIYDLLESKMYQLTTQPDDFFAGSWLP